MTLKLYAHPFSSYCQKVLIALYENDTPFEFRMLAPDDEAGDGASSRRYGRSSAFPCSSTRAARWSRRASSSSISGSIIPARCG